MIFMDIIEHGWNISLRAFGLGGLCVTLGWGPMRIFAVFTICMCTFPEVGGCQGGHGKVELLFGAAPALCRNTPYGTAPPPPPAPAHLLHSPRTVAVVVQELLKEEDSQWQCIERCGPPAPVTCVCCRVSSCARRPCRAHGKGHFSAYASDL